MTDPITATGIALLILFGTGSSTLSGPYTNFELCVHEAKWTIAANAERHPEMVAYCIDGLEIEMVSVDAKSWPKEELDLKTIEAQRATDPRFTLPK